MSSNSTNTTSTTSQKMAVAKTKSSARHHHDRERHHHNDHRHREQHREQHPAADSLAVAVEDEDVVVDSEWADFDRLLTEYRLRRRHNAATCPSPLVLRRDLQDLMGKGGGLGKGRVSQAFYPCPPPSAGLEPDDMDYVQTAVSVAWHDMAWGGVAWRGQGLDQVGPLSPLGS